MAGLETTPEMFDLRMSESAKPLLEKVKAFIKNEVDPITARVLPAGRRTAPTAGRGRRVSSSCSTP